MKKAYLVLEDGTVFEGVRFGAETEALGELVFTTGVVGYVETLTDPSFCGQIVVQTFPLIGNYGVHEEDAEGVFALSGYVVREVCEVPSNFRSECDLDTYLKKMGVPCIAGVDTRELTRLVREHGTMNAAITDTIPENTDAIRAYRVTDAVATVTADAPHTVEGEGKCRVAVLDFGVKKSLIRALTRRGCTVTVLPADSAADDVLATKPDGIVLPGGPGDPAENVAAVETVRALCGKVPMLGIGLGHQVLALACGAKTEKMKHGHRGANQPVRDTATGETYITSQNHGYAVLADTLPEGARISHANVNDGTCEGVFYEAARAFSVQFDPDDGKGPRSTAFVFDRFVQMMGGEH